MQFLTRFAVSASFLALSACAGSKYATLHGDGDADDFQGIRYYESAPFVLVHSDGKGGLTAQFLWLPDTTRVRVVRPYAWLAKNNATYTFSNGVMTSAKNVVDETIVPAAVISAVKQVALARLPTADSGAGPSTRTVPPPALFRIVSAPDGRVLLRGSYGVDEDDREIDINVTVSEPDKREKGK